MKWSKTNGLIAATLTPFHQDGSVNLDIIGRYVDHLLSIGITQVFVNGTAGEHASLTVEEREAIAERWIKEGKGKLTRIIIQVGTLNLPDSQRLAAHAEAIGADGISVITPCYYATSDISSLVDYCAAVAHSAPKTPFMYYHFPAITHATFRLTDWLLAAEKKIPTLIGAKCTCLDLYDACDAANLFGGRFDVPVGADFQQLGAMAMGLPGAIGISFSLLGKAQNRMVQAYNAGDIATAQREQFKVQEFWNASGSNAGLHPMIASFKAIMKLNGLDIGSPRLPIKPLDDAKVAELSAKLEAMAFSKWIQ